MNSMMKDKKGFELAISTLVIIVLGIMVLAALTLAFTGGFKKFWNIIIGYSGSDIDNLNKICKSQCDLDNKQGFCCEKKDFGKEKITCLDSKLKVDCSLSCEGIC